MADHAGTTPDRPAAGVIQLNDRVVLWSGLGAVTLLGWLYLIWMPMAPRDFGALGAHILGMMSPSISDAALMFLMWAVMMVAMMLPSAAPMIETYARLVAGRGESSGLRVSIFAAGYLLVWTLFSAVATVAQLSLQRLGAVTGAMTATPLVGAVLLIAAGTYQLMPLKNACLTRCRTPLGFLMSEWRDGALGALLMGVRHGAICVGCCSMLMVLLFVFGVMNLLWVAALSIFVLLEKLLPGGRVISRVSGVAMLAGGLAVLVR